MKFFDKRSFLDVSSFNVSLLKALGYFHFSIDDIRSKEVQLKADEYLRLLFYIIAGFYVSLKASNLNVGTRNSLIFQIGMNILLQISMFAPVIYRSYNFSVRNVHKKIIEDVHWVDQKLVQLGVEIDHPWHFKVALGVTGFYFISFAVTIFVDESLRECYLPDLRVHISEGLFAMINVIAYMWYQVSHMLIILTIYVRLKYLHKVLKGNDRELEVIKMIRIAHLKLVENLRQINCCYTVNILNYFFQFSFFNIFFYFGLVHQIFFESTTEEVIFSFIIFAWVQFFFWFGAWIMLYSVLIKLETEYTKRTVLNKIFKSVDRKAQKALILFSFQFEHEEVSITAKLFYVDLKLLFAMFGTVFSYIIILIQFEAT